jgi:hypothetical protein
MSTRFTYGFLHFFKLFFRNCSNLQGVLLYQVALSITSEPEVILLLVLVLLELYVKWPLYLTKQDMFNGVGVFV